MIQNQNYSRLRQILSILILGALCSCSTPSTVEDLHFSIAHENGVLANEGFKRCLQFTHAWLEYTDSASGLIPENLYNGIDTWNAHNSAADNYPFMVLTSYLLDKQLYNTTMHQILVSETALTSRIRSLPDAYSFSKEDFVRENIDTARIIFGTSEYIKDGIIPLTEYLGESPWSKRMVKMVDDLQGIVTVARNMKGDSYWNTVEDEISGELLQTLSRLFWMTGEERYLKWAIEIGDHYLLEKDLTQAERLRLRDHGCEIIAGISELYFAVHYKYPEKAATYRPAIYRVMDRILEIGRNGDGMFYNEVNMLTGEVLDSSIVDNWGYIYNAYYTVYLLDNRKEYREAVIKPLKSVNEGYRNFNWERGSADGFADAIESGINLYNRERIPELKEWINSEIQVMWSLQDSSYQERALRWMDSGIIEGWHGDGNFARTTLMYCLWKTEDLTIEPWREDVVFGATLENGILYISLEAEADWEGTLQFGAERHQTILKLPLDYPRINQFPEWYTINEEQGFVIEDSDGEEKIVVGRELCEGLPVKLKKGKPCMFKLGKYNL